MILRCFGLWSNYTVRKTELIPQPHKDKQTSKHISSFPGLKSVFFFERDLIKKLVKVILVQTRHQQTNASLGIGGTTRGSGTCVANKLFLQPERSKQFQERDVLQLRL